MVKNWCVYHNFNFSKLRKKSTSFCRKIKIKKSALMSNIPGFSKNVQPLRKFCLNEITSNSIDQTPPFTKIQKL